MRSLLLSLAIAAAPAFAGDLLLKNRETGAELRLNSGPCVNATVLGELKDEWAPKFKAASAIVDGKKFGGCWIEDAGRAVLFFENGERFMAPLSKFSDQML